MKKILLLSFALSASMMMLASSAKSLNENRVHIPADGRIELVGSKTLTKLGEASQLVANPVKTKALNKVLPGAGLKAAPTAYYARPQGFFFWGMDMESSSYPMPILLGAGYSTAIWPNFSTDATSNLWKYADPEDMTSEAILESPAKHLTVNYTQHFANTPILNATSADGGSTYQMKGATNPGYYGAGGTATLDNKTNFGVSSKDFSSGVTAFYAGAAGDWWFGTGPSAKAEGVIGMATYMEKPVHSYALTSMFAFVRNFVAEPDAEFSVTLRKITDDGKFGEVIATGKCLAGNATNLGDDSAGGIFAILPFAFEQEDPSGLTEEIIPTIDSAVLVEFTGYQSPKVTSMTFTVAKDNMPDAYGECGYFILEDSEGRSVYPISKFFTNPLYTAPSLFMDVVYTWFESAENQFAVPNEGGSKTFEVNSYFMSEAWSVVEEDNGTLPSWITYDKADTETTQTLTFTVDPLPNGVAGRSFDVTMSIPGSTKVYKITQGTGGVNDVTVSDIKAVVTGGDIEVSYPATVSAVKIYNVSGQLVKDVALTEAGSSVIPAQELAKGVYIMQFNDNQSVKVIK